ncbi:hypothetical protein ACL03H_04410 [Saccharopolyspora sp. MS10]|uniref:hypothetical protein n=1 Tax=Saccharopolyspora sp. MS10 TaxID=3385973 RepID=UPI0039A34160
MTQVAMSRRRESRAGRAPAATAVPSGPEWAAEADRVLREFRTFPTGDARSLRNALRWSFEHLGTTFAPGASNAEELFQQASEKLLFEQGEAAFNRTLAPVLRELARLSPDGTTLSRSEFVRWLRVLGLHPARALHACDRARARYPGDLPVAAMLRVLRDYHLAPAPPGGP